jgi:hypothetical protein
MATNRRSWAIAAAGVMLAIVCIFAFWQRAPAQLANDESLFKTVDALYTAVRMKDAARVVECEKRLAEAHAAGRLSEAAWHQLEVIIDETNAGNWQPAAESLYAFMLGQRRE